MLKSKHHIVIYPLFKVLTRILIKRNFNSVSIIGDFNDTGNAVLIIANHVSWWDGFWLMLLNLKLVHRKFHFMMLENQLRKHWYFQYTGAYSVKKKSRSAVNSLNYTLELLTNQENMVLIFPQGEINTMHTHEIKFEKGIDRIIEGTNRRTQVLFVANLVDYFSKSKPNLFTYIDSILIEDVINISIEKAYNDFYKKILQKHKTMIS